MPYLNLSKRFEFSATRRYFRHDWSARRNLEMFGPAAVAEFGEGHNYTAYFSFEGPVDPSTGMVRELSLIKERLRTTLLASFDHHYLNADTPPFSTANLVPTPENMALLLLSQARDLFEFDSVKPVVCHLTECLGSEATAYASGRIERHRWFGPFPIRRQAGKLDFFHLRVTVEGTPHPESGMLVSEQTLWPIIEAEVDARFLTQYPIEDVAETIDHCWSLLCKKMVPARIMLCFGDQSLVEFDGTTNSFGVKQAFSAVHRLMDTASSVYENQLKFGKCFRYHGHLFSIEPTVISPQFSDESLGELTAYLTDALSAVAGRVLDQTVLKGVPATCESLITFMWAKLKDHPHLRLSRLRLWETPNNRFSLRSL